MSDGLWVVLPWIQLRCGHAVHKHAAAIGVRLQVAAVEPAILGTASMGEGREPRVRGAGCC